MRRDSSKLFWWVVEKRFPNDAIRKTFDKYMFYVMLVSLILGKWAQHQTIADHRSISMTNLFKKLIESLMIPLKLMHSCARTVCPFYVNVALFSTVSSGVCLCYIRGAANIYAEKLSIFSNSLDT